MNNTAKFIAEWIDDYANDSSMNGFVVGISGGIDSSVVSTLCASTGKPTTVITMPIKQKIEQNDLSMAHAKWLTDRYDNVSHQIYNLDAVFDEFKKLFYIENTLALANSRSRLRMTTLYQVSQTQNALVVGTGNKVEDFGIGFYTKYGDGGVDISPIADCYKTEVWDMGRSMGILQDIIDAEPTEGLWDDGRTDQEQIGMSYEQLEYAMQVNEGMPNVKEISDTAALEKYALLRKPNLHKMNPIPVCKIPKKIRNSI